MKELIYIRHGERPNMQDDINIINEWKESIRYKENPFDEPLTSYGELEATKTGINLTKLMDLSKYNYIYSSPLTRCIETSKNIIDSIYKITGRRLKIRIEYAFNEVLYMLGRTQNFFNFFGNKIRETNVINVEISGEQKQIYYPIDDKLKFYNLVAKYRGYIDESYRSMLSDDSKLMDQRTCIKYFKNALDRIIGQENNIMICAHGGEVYYLLYNYLTQAEFNYNKIMDIINKTGSKKKIIFVSIFKRQDNKWKNILKPVRII